MVQEALIPKHIGIIMDGNRRWAKKRGKFAVFGHRAGIKSLQSIRKAVLEEGIKFLTVWAFSTENWKRDQKEVDGMIGLLRSYLSNEKELSLLEKDEISLKIIGDLSRFPEDIQELAKKAVKRLANGKELIFSIALNYGGRDEIRRMVEKIIKTEKKFVKVTDSLIENFLDTAGIPDPDLIIRTGGSKRLSGFLPWQSVYSELYFTDIFWPDFNPEELNKSLNWFADQKRNFGE